MYIHVFAIVRHSVYHIFQLVNLLGWAVATTMALLVLYGLYDSSGMPHLSNNVSAFYNATNRSAWALAVCWVIAACATGHGGMLKLTAFSNK